jgi:aspartate racemase
MMGRPVVGIIGGLGPQATCTLYQRIIDCTPAAGDQDHLHLIIKSDPSAPDRTEALLGRGPSPLESLLRSARLLQAAGAELLAMPCVTAHAWIDQLRAGLQAPLLSVVEETAGRIEERHGSARRIGLLATEGTVRSGVFGPLAAGGRQLVLPSAAGQKDVTAAIYGPRGVKTVGPNPQATALLAGAARELVSAGAEIIVAGCTEVPLAIGPNDVAVPLVDTLEVLARAVVRRAMAAEVHLTEKEHRT